MPFNFRLPYTKTVTSGQQVEAHESFGMVSIGRIQGSRRLFGSSIESHGSFFRLSIRQAEVIHDLSHDRYHDTNELISIDLSASQFAEMITTLNIGMGTPCTINRVLGEKVELPPVLSTEAEKIRNTFESDIRGLSDKLRESVKQVGEILNKKSLNAEDKKKILGSFQKVLQDIESNAPFVVSSFQEAADRVVATSKAEMDAFLSLLLQKKGVSRDALGEGSPTPILPAPSDSSSE